MKVFFYPLAACYEIGVRARWQLYASGVLRVSRLTHPVISIGNLTMGGTGKTPTTVALAKLLQGRGFRVSILLRGYRSQHHGSPLLVSDGRQITESVDNAGDEAVVLAANVPGAVVAVGKNRAAAGAWVERHFAVDVHLLDDGFQHLGLHRDLNLLLIDVTNPFGGGLPPSGRLREPLRAIQRADAVMLTRTEAGTDCSDLIERVRKFKSGIPCFTIRQRFVSAQVLGEAGTVPVGILRNLRAIAFAGIANPGQFFNMLRRSEAQMLDAVGFRDHHDYVPADCERLKARAQSLAVDALITTEKDAVKLEAAAFAPLKVLVVKLAFEFDKLEGLERLISSVMPVKR